MAGGRPLLRVTRYGVDSDRTASRSSSRSPARGARRYGTELRTIACSRITED